MLYFVLVPTKSIHIKTGHCHTHFTLYFEGLKLNILHITMINFNMN